MVAVVVAATHMKAAGPQGRRVVVADPQAVAARSVELVRKEA